MQALIINPASGRTEPAEVFCNGIGKPISILFADHTEITDPTEIDRLIKLDETYSNQVSERRMLLQDY